jgi:periplasmic protein TonB
MKNTIRNWILLTIIVFTIGTPDARTAPASGGDDERNIEKIAIKRVQPAYPPNAQKYRIEGVVTVSVSVNSEGKVSKAEFVRGHNLFRSVSLDAAKRWEFKLSGESSLEGTIRFTFKLSQ